MLRCESRSWCGADHEHAPVDRDRRDRRAARVEDDDVGRPLGGEPCALDHVRDEDLAREAAAGATAADRRHAGRRAAISRWSEAAWRPVRESATRSSTVGRRSISSGVARPAAAHRDDDDVAVAGEQRGEMRGDRGLADALARTDHRDRRHVGLPRRVGRRVEAKVGAEVRQPGGKRARRPAEALLGPEHGLVGEVDDELGVAEAIERAARRSRRRREASRCRRRGSRPPIRTAARRARRGRRRGSARRR